MLSSVVALAVQDPQDREEEIEDVEVQANAGGDLFFNVIMSHDQLRVHKNICGEDKSTGSTIDEFHCRAVWEEGRHEAEDDHNPQGAEEVGHPAGEIVFCLAGEQSQEDKDAQCDDECFDNDARLVEGGDHTDAIRFKSGKAGEEDYVCWVGLAFPECEKHKSNGAEQRHPHHPAVRLNPVSVAGREEGDRRQACCEEDLDREDCVDFADELHADVERGFCDGAAKLVNMLVLRMMKRVG